MIKNFFKNLPIILLAAAVGVTFSFSVGSIKEAFTRIIAIKMEDILLLILGLIWIANILISGKKRFQKPPLFFPILVWLSVGLFSVLTNWIFGNIGLYMGFFYFLKEVEFFFLYFYLFYHIKSINSVKFIIKIWIFLGLVNISWVVYQIVENIKGYYGPGAIGEEAGIFPSGVFFLIMFVFLFNILLFYYFSLKISNLKKTILAIFTFAPVFGLFATGSRTAAAGFFFAILITFLLYFFKEKKKAKVFLIITLILIIGVASYFFLFPKLGAAKRAINFLKGIPIQLNPESRSGRSIIWKANTEGFLKKPLFIFFGAGKSVFFVYGESHSQYVRNFIETGIIGFLVFLFLVFMIIKKSLRQFLLSTDPFVIGLASGLFIATLTMLFISIVGEPFIIVKPAETYWFFTALTMAVLAFKKPLNILENEKKI